MATPTGHAYKVRKAQVGKEATWNLSVAATAILGELKDATLTLDMPLEKADTIGSFAPATSVDVMSVGGTFDFEGYLTYEDAPFLLQALLGEVAPTGAGPYVRDYTSPHQSSYNPVSYTFEFGIESSSQKYKTTGNVLMELELTIVAKKYVEYKAKFGFGNVAVLGAFTVLSTRTLTKIRAMDHVVAIDAWGGTPGTTTVSATVREASIKISSGAHMKDYIDSAYAQGFGLDQWSLDGELTAECNATTEAYIASMIGAVAVQKILQLQATRGAQINKLIVPLALDGAGQKIYENYNGNAGFKFKIASLREATLGYFLKATNTNTIAVLPY